MDAPDAHGTHVNTSGARHPEAGPASAPWRAASVEQRVSSDVRGDADAREILNDSSANCVGSVTIARLEFFRAALRQSGLTPKF